jgi:hypothetical protein
MLRIWGWVKGVLDMRAITRFAVAAAALVSASAFAGSSQAAIFIGLQQAGVNSGNIVTVASGAASAVFAASYGTFELELITGVPGVDPSILGSTTNDTNALATTAARWTSTSRATTSPVRSRSSSSARSPRTRCRQAGR